MAECPTCGDTFSSEHGMKIHHANVHGESIATTTLTCDQCGDVFERKDWQAENDYDGTFCSLECRESVYNPGGTEDGFDCPTCGKVTETRQGMRAHHSRVHEESLTYEENVCEKCGDSFRARKDRNRRFCSKECQYEKGWHRTGEDSPHWSQVTVSCANCGEQFSVWPSRLDGRENKYCDWDCYVEHRDYPSGEDHPLYLDGKGPYYGANWSEQRLKAIERDDAQCVKCDMTRDDHFDEYGRDLHVHHLTPVKSFDNVTDAHYLDNLMTVCSNCHIDLEHSDETDPTALSV